MRALQNLLGWSRWAVVGWSLTLCASSQAAALPVVLQAALIAKIFQADDTIRARGHDSAKLVIVNSPGDTDFAKTLDEALGPTQIVTQVLSPTQLVSLQGAVSAVYVASAAESDTIQKFCAERQVLSISGLTELADRGIVAVAVGMNQESHPEIVVNPKLLAIQHHVLAPSLLRLARIVSEK